MENSLGIPSRVPTVIKFIIGFIVLLSTAMWVYIFIGFVNANCIGKSTKQKRVAPIPSPEEKKISEGVEYIPLPKEEVGILPLPAEEEIREEPTLDSNIIFDDVGSSYYPKAKEVVYFA